MHHLSVETVLANRGVEDHIHRKLDSRRQRMSVLKRCRFQLQGTAEFDTFIERLKEYIAALRNICSELQATVGLDGRIET